MTNVEQVALLYDSIASAEAERLRLHPVERRITLDAIVSHLGLDVGGSEHGPDRAIRVADIGGGPGVYAFALADRGAQVHLRDLSPKLLELATAEQSRRQLAAPCLPLLESIEVGNALDTWPVEDRGTFDAVLLLGPLYHLLEHAERVTALRNALDLLSENDMAFVVAAFIPRTSHLRDLARRDPERMLREQVFYDEYLRTGRYVKLHPTPRSSYHVGSPEEVEELVRSAGGKVVELVAAESILGGGLDSKLVRCTDEVLESWISVLKPLARESRQLGCADHWIAIIQRCR